MDIDKPNMSFKGRGYTDKFKVILLLIKKATLNLIIYKESRSI